MAQAAAAAGEALRRLGRTTQIVIGTGVQAGAEVDAVKHGSAPAVRQTVLEALNGAAWAHFFCHAPSDPMRPSAGQLQLTGTEALSVLDICKVHTRAARRVFLAACGTARTSQRLPDEAMHITSAFLVAGFPEAVGTLWEIDSVSAAEVTRIFHARVHDELIATTSAFTLHETIRELKSRHPNQPHVWAAYLHAGV